MPGGEEEISEMIERKEEARKRANPNPPEELEVSDVTKKLSKIFDVPYPKTWEDLARQYNISVAEIKADPRYDVYSAWTGRVRRDIPMEAIRYRRLKPQICELDMMEFGVSLGFFTPSMKLRLMKDRAEMCGDRIAGEILEIKLYGDPTSRLEIEKKGLITFWKESYKNDEDVVTELVGIGYTRAEAEGMVGVKRTMPELESELEKVKRMEEEIRERMKKIGS